MAAHKPYLFFLSFLSFSFQTLSRDLYYPPSSDSNYLLSFSFTTLPLINLHRLSSSTAAAAAADVHDLLPQYGLPRGLLPNRVKSYTLSKDGSFALEFESHCYVHYPMGEVYFEKTISGKVSYGSIHDVQGIKAKKLFLWVPVTGIVSDLDSGEVEFFVGFVSEKFPADQFEDIPVCENRACKEESDLIASI